MTAKRDRHGRIIAGTETTALEVFERTASSAELEEIDRYARYIMRERHVDESFKSARDDIKRNIRKPLCEALRELAMARTAILAKNRASYRLHCALAGAKLNHVQALFSHPFRERAAKNTGRPLSTEHANWLTLFDGVTRGKMSRAQVTEKIFRDCRDQKGRKVKFSAVYKVVLESRK